MEASDKYLKGRETMSKISILELKRLLILLAENVHNVGFRYRLIGQMWEPGFMRVSQVSDHGVTFKDDTKSRIKSVPDLRMIMQFEIDSPLHTFEPNFHYDIVPD